MVTTQVTSLLSHDGVAVVLESSSFADLRTGSLGVGSARLAPCPEPKLKQLK